MVTKLKQLVGAVNESGKKHLIAAYANDAHTICAISSAIDRGIVDATLVGSKERISSICSENGIDITKFNIIECERDSDCVALAVSRINQGKADILMKGSVSTDKYMRGILAKEGGLVSGKSTLSHVTIVEVPTYHKLMILTDVAVIPAPTLQQKVSLTRYAIDVAHHIGIERPKVAIIAPTEQMLPGISSCVDAAIISKMADRGQIAGADVDGPLSLDVAIDKESAQIKGVKSVVNAEADCLVFPNIEAANVFFKSTTKLCGGELAAIVVGAKVPCVLTSRGDSEESKLYSIALAVLCAK